jgi:DNA-binding NtrC family response regulator
VAAGTGRSAAPAWRKPGPKLCQFGTNFLKPLRRQADVSMSVLWKTGLGLSQTSARIFPVMASRKATDVTTSQTQSADVLQDIVVADPKMQQVIEFAKKVAPHKAAVLITGETGSGKELIARVIHQHSNRRAKPWVDVNCAALPEHLVESELFGYERGAFSGAYSAKPGLFEIANGGTLFLDEIGELEPKVQVKLLRVLDNAPYYRLGGNRKVSVDVRVLAATNRDLQAAVQTGSFRRDLYHRITEVQVQVPPLRERPQDIVALADHFLERCCPGRRFTPEALQLLTDFEWRGNVRELHNLVLKLAISTTGPEITAEEAAACMPVEAAAETISCTNTAALDQLERQMIVRALEMTRGNQSLAAEHLGMPRRTFCRKLNHYQITLGRRSSSTKTAGQPDAYHRTELNVPVCMTTHNGRSFTAEARNLSLGGIGLQNVQPALLSSEELTLSFTLPGTSHPIQVQGIVVWSQPNGNAGIRFSDVNDSSTELLRTWIANNRQVPVETLALIGPLYRSARQL